MVNLYCKLEWIEKYLGDEQGLLVEVSEAVCREKVLREDGPARLWQHSRLSSWPLRDEVSRCPPVFADTVVTWPRLSAVEPAVTSLRPLEP